MDLKTSREGAEVSPMCGKSKINVKLKHAFKVKTRQKTYDFVVLLFGGRPFDFLS